MLREGVGASHWRASETLSGAYKFEKSYMHTYVYMDVREA